MYEIMIKSIILLVLYLPPSTDAFITTTHLNNQKSFTSTSKSKLSSYSTSTLSEKKLIRIAQAYVENPTPDKLSSDFIFRGPVIGPLNKADFVATLTDISSYDDKNDASSTKKSGLAEAFPDLQPNNFGFSVDPIEKNRVWYFTRPTGTFQNAFDHPVKGRIEPTNAPYRGPPEARSVIIDMSDGLIKYQSVGYVVDRFTNDTTDGKGAVFGMYHVMGDELDGTVGSWKMIFLQWLSTILPEGTVPKSFSKKDELPEWWKSERMGAQ